MTPALQQAYADSCLPFIDGAISAETVKRKPWRVFLEVNSACNLFCPTCTKGNQRPIEGLRYEHKSGFMDMDLMERILDKIANENPVDILSVNPNVPPALVAFLDRAMSKNPDERFQTGEEFAGALRAAMGGGATPSPAAAASSGVDIQL